MSKSKRVLQLTPAGLDARRETTAPLMHMIQLSPLSSYVVLEVVEIIRASFVHFLLRCHHTL